MGEPTGMETLATFLTARYDETEADIARWKSGDPHPGEPHTNDLDGDPAGEHYTMYDDSCERCIVVARLSRKVNPYAVHSFGLADLAAKRAILAEHQPLLSRRGTVECSTCVDTPNEYQEEWTRYGWPCTTVAALAGPFAGHPEFQETWRLT